MISLNGAIAVTGFILFIGTGSFLNTHFENQRMAAARATSVPIPMAAVDIMVDEKTSAFEQLDAQTTAAILGTVDAAKELATSAVQFGWNCKTLGLSAIECQHLFKQMIDVK